jgi:peptidoglycan hydrolase-like protein with peptidoglycan-binding domain
MKRLCGMLIFSLLFTFQVLATNAPKEIYTIQIGSFTNPQAEQFQFLSGIGMVYLEQVPNSNLHRVLVSKFEDKTIANEYLAKIKSAGYSDAFVTARTIDDAKTVRTIQLGSYRIGEQLDLTKEKALGKIALHIKDDEIRVLIGYYTDITSAKVALDKARANGFPSAFMKETDIVWLTTIGNFEENFLKFGVQKIEQIAAQPKIIVPSIIRNPNENPNTYNSVKTGNEGDPTKAKASVAGLQEALKGDNKYKGNVDGIYGNNTREGLNAFQQNDEMYQRYSERTRAIPQTYSEKGNVSTLQGNIDLIEFNPALAAENLQNFAHPLAKVYTAYLYFTGLVKTTDERTSVNLLMNNAIQQAFANFDGESRFNYSKQYNYTDIQILIQHLAYVYNITQDNPKIPCWMVEYHNAELSQAFAGLNPPSFTDCEGFESIKEIRILQAMAQDMDVLSETERLAKSKAEKQAYTARRTELYLNPPIIALPEQELYEMWNTNLLNAVERNIEKDPLRKDILTAFKVTYFMVYGKLENHYLLNDYPEDQAKALAIATLYALVNYNLGDYITEY